MRPLTFEAKQWIAVVLVLCVGAVAAWLIVRHRLDPQIRRTHTEFLFVQFEHSYADSLRKGSPPAASEPSFRALIPTWTTDWNTTEFRGGAVIDSWGRPVQIRTDSTTIHLRSAGPDRQFNTSDDIVRE